MSAKKTAKKTKSATAGAAKGTRAQQSGGGASARTGKGKAAKPKKLSALDAAAKVLGEAKEAMTTRALVEAMAIKCGRPRLASAR